MKKLRFPIALKLVGLTTLLLFAVTALIAAQSSEYFEAEVRQTHELSNQVQTENRATEVETLLQGYVDKIRLLASLMILPESQGRLREDMLHLAFRPDRDLVSVEIHEFKNGRATPLQKLRNEDFLKEHRLPTTYLDGVRSIRPFPLEPIFAGSIEILNSSIKDGLPLITIGVPFVKDAFERVSHVAVADIRLDKLQKTFSARGASQIFLVDKRGRVLAHPDDKLVMEARSLRTNPLVDAALQSKFRSNHLPGFLDPADSKKHYGVFNRTSFGVSVIAQIPEQIILEPAQEIRRQAFHVGGLVLSAALFLIFLFSISLTRPIEKLLELTYEVAKGRFDIHAAQRIRTHDEVKDLAVAFDHMTTGLKALVKTQGADVAQTLMESDLEHLGGTKKQVTVLFSDLRDFTKFSEGHTPEEVVEMLNEYFEIMVGCIERNQGRVNKFIGDAIMAMWGAPSSTGDDEYLATKTALEMRLELDRLNTRRLARGDTPIKIGVGIHCGVAVAGTIGSKSRLEYTIIGDTVNQASRLEASTKAFGADLLLSQEVIDKIEGRFIVDFAGAAEVKGKSEPLKMFKVKGYYDDQRAPVLVQTPYSDYEAQAVDKVKVA